MVAIVEKNYNIEGVYRHNDGKKKKIIQMLEYRLNQNGARIVVESSQTKSHFLFHRLEIQICRHHWIMFNYGNMNIKPFFKNYKLV
jgi:hypothetical protein